MNKFEETKIQIYLHKFLILVAIIGSLNYFSIALFKYNLIEQLGNYLKITNFKKIIYIIIGICGFLLFERDTLLPFLGHSVYPCEPLKEVSPENYNIEIKIKTIANTNIIYWASESSENVFDNPYDAYGDYSNNGVARSDQNGIATLKVRKPSNYYVPMKPEPLRKHIHYRICNGNGILSRIETVYV
jgi:uncharacterized membrane protein YuzA (DUF378 family)